MKCKECVRYKFCDSIVVFYTHEHLKDDGISCVDYIPGTTKDQDGYFDIKRKDEKWKKVLNYLTD